MLIEGKTKENENDNFNEKENYGQNFNNLSGNKNNKKTKLTIKLKSKFQNDNNFFYSILKSNGEDITNKDFTQNYTKSDFNSTLSDKKYEIESKKLIYSFKIF
jgi:hypothetical protein